MHDGLPGEDKECIVAPGMNTILDTSTRTSRLHNGISDLGEYKTILDAFPLLLPAFSGLPGLVLALV